MNNQSTRDRPTKIMLLLSKYPDEFSLKALSEKFNVSSCVIKDDFNALKSCGIQVKHTGYPDYFYFIENVKRTGKFFMYKIEDNFIDNFKPLLNRNTRKKK